VSKYPNLVDRQIGPPPLEVKQQQHVKLHVNKLLY